MAKKIKDKKQIVNEKHIELYDKTLGVLEFLLNEFAHDIRYAEFEYLDIPKNTLGLDNEMAENEEPQINIIEGLSEGKI